jgi:hypothetical protein
MQMVITDVIREAETEYVIYFLLMAYINAARNSDTPNSLPEQIAALPLTGKDDARLRFEALMLALDAASKRCDDYACIVLKDALSVFGTAVYRLQSLDGRRYWPLEIEKQAA